MSTFTFFNETMSITISVRAGTIELAYRRLQELISEANVYWWKLKPISRGR